MFKITPIQDKNEQKSVAEACGAEFKPTFLAYSMREGKSGELMGFSQFELSAEYGIISDLKPAGELSDYEAMFILGRATMNFIDLCELHTCRATEGAGEDRLLHAIGFRKNKDFWECDMTGMFDGHCSGEKGEEK